MTPEFLAECKEASEKMNTAIAFIKEEGLKMGIKLDDNQACTFANIVMKVYGVSSYAKK